MLHACARPVDNNSVSACAPGTACRASTLRCVVISLRTGFSASYFLRLAMPVQVLRTFPATARCALVSPASLLGAVCSHASHACAAGRHLLRLSMCARHFVPNAHASLRRYLPCVAARRCASPPQNCSFVPPPAAVTVLPPPGHAKAPVRRTAISRSASFCGLACIH